ncbi:tyrosine-protein phosphatase [Kitasatospora camelliae]|uniref:Tyrosine-protein phosphatase n=1 Tax=Kitasatospora camelliae TaxID=3156397 RepID=A0AAU8K0M8_9ACTN
MTDRAPDATTAALAATVTTTAALADLPVVPDVPAVPNFRDAGGGLLRAGLLYRSGGLHGLAPEGARRIGELGIRTVVDLRSELERSVWPDRRDGFDAEHLHLPLLPERTAEAPSWPSDQRALYLLMAESGGQAIAGTVRALATGHPVLVHCAVGKDRTGLTVAVVHRLAGLPEAEITADFLRSNRALGLHDGPVPYLDEHGRERISQPVEETNLHAALAHIEARHGGVEGYLLAHGATEADLAAVRTLLSA